MNLQFFFTSFLCITISRAPDLVVFEVEAGGGGGGGGTGVRSASTALEAAGAIVGSLLCCDVSIVHPLFNLLYYVIWLLHLAETP